MKHFLRFVATFGFVIIMSTFFANDTHASVSHKDSAPLEGTQSLDPTFNKAQITKDRLQPFYSRMYLRDGDIIIQSNGNKITTRGTTTSYSPVSKIHVKIFLERWDPSRELWIPIYDTTFSENNASRVMGATQHTVPSGYYYRARARHWISQGTIIEEDRSQTSYIYIK